MNNRKGNKYHTINNTIDKQLSSFKVKIYFFATILCKSNTSEMREFRSLFTQTFQESSRESLSDNLMPFERNFPGTKNAFSSTFWYKTKFHDQKHCFTNLVPEISH